MNLEINEKKKPGSFKRSTKLTIPQLNQPRHKIPKPGMKTSLLTPKEIITIIKYTMKNFMPTN